MRTKNDIAKEFGFHRNTITKWFSRPGAPKAGPKGYDLEEVGRYIAECSAKESSMAKASPKMRELKEQEIAERIRKLRLANDSKERTLIPRSEHEAQLREMATECQRILYTIPTMAPELSGLPVVEIERRLTARLDDALRTIVAGAKATER